jgi:hypothetical protein
MMDPAERRAALKKAREALANAIKTATTPGGK